MTIKEILDTIKDLEKLIERLDNPRRILAADEEYAEQMFGEIEEHLTRYKEILNNRLESIEIEI